MDDAGRRVIGRTLGVVIVAGALLTSVWSWWLTYRHPRTDDAAVRANIVGIAPHVSGSIVELHVVDNQLVREGELLFVVDPRPYEARLAAAHAALALAGSDVSAQRAAVAAAEADLERRTVEERYAGDHLGRVEPLLGRGFVTADRVEDARTKLRAARAARERTARERERAEQLLAQEGDANARIEAARAELRTAELNVEYCRVHAPFEAWVTNLNLAVGQYAREGQEVFALVDNRAWYVMANFRETFLANIRPGMAADVFLLSYPGHRVHGVVQGIGWALHQPDGATVGVLPAVEPTLDWVRLAQRFPVRIRLDPPAADRPYRMGATAVVTVGRGSEDAAAR